MGWNDHLDIEPSEFDHDSYVDNALSMPKDWDRHGLNTDYRGKDFNDAEREDH